MITGRQIRAARALLEWDAEDLADKAQLSRDTVFNIENGVVQARGGSMEKIMHAFADGGIEFTENQGVRMKAKGVEIFDGAERFDDFSNYLYNHLSQHGGDVCLSIGDEESLFKYRKDPAMHRKRLKELCDKGVIKSFRILANKSKFSPTFSTYKKQKGADFSPTGFYAFGDCLALISFTQNTPYVVVLESAPLTSAYRKAFEIAWEAADPPPPPTQEKNA